MDVINISDLTLQQTVLAERSARLQHDAELARLRRFLRRRSRTGRRSEGAPSGRLTVALREHAIERSIVTVIESPRDQAA